MRGTVSISLKYNFSDAVGYVFLIGLVLLWRHSPFVHWFCFTIMTWLYLYLSHWNWLTDEIIANRFDDSCEIDCCWKLNVFRASLYCGFQTFYYEQISVIFHQMKRVQNHSDRQVLPYKLKFSTTAQSITHLIFHSIQDLLSWKTPSHLSH